MIRPIEPSDAPEVRDIIVDSLRYEGCQADVVRRRVEELSGDDRCISLVCVDDRNGRVCGFVHALRYDTLHSEGGWDVISLAVAPDAQGLGIGRALLSRLEDQVRERGGSFVRLNSSMSRTAAHEFYEHVGYVCDKVQKHFVRAL